LLPGEWFWLTRFKNPPALWSPFLQCIQSKTLRCCGGVAQTQAVIYDPNSCGTIDDRAWHPPLSARWACPRPGRCGGRRRRGTCRGSGPPPPPAAAARTGRTPAPPPRPRAPCRPPPRPRPGPRRLVGGGEGRVVTMPVEGVCRQRSGSVVVCPCWSLWCST